MAYTAVPQGNQTIAATQVPILTNFAFLQTGLNKEHNFDATGTGTNMYHRFASMPDNADPGAPTGVSTGTYYVNNSSPYFRNALGIFKIVNCFPGDAYFRTSTTFLSGPTNTPTTFYTVPNNSMGSYWIIRPGGSTYAMGTWISVSGNVQVASTGTNTGTTIVSGSGLALRFQFNGSSGDTFSYTVQINTP